MSCEIVGQRVRGRRGLLVKAGGGGGELLLWLLHRASSVLTNAGTRACPSYLLPVPPSPQTHTQQQKFHWLPYLSHKLSMARTWNLESSMQGSGPALGGLRTIRHGSRGAWSGIFFGVTWKELVEYRVRVYGLGF